MAAGDITAATDSIHTLESDGAGEYRFKYVGDTNNKRMYIQNAGGNHVAIKYGSGISQTDPDANPAQTEGEAILFPPIPLCFRDGQMEIAPAGVFEFYHRASASNATNLIVEIK